MLTTVELRWFYNGILLEEMKQWFQHDMGGYLEPPEEREDVYLHAVGCDYLGIKLRQKQLEVKWRKAELGVLSFGDKVEGEAEKWVKWACTDTTDSPILQEAMAQKPWVSVNKVRSQRHYQVSGSTAIAVPAKELIDQGCNVELTQLSINDNEWWSLAFEAFGEDDCLMNNLQAVASWVFKNYGGPKLLAENSYAYPSWLSLVV